MRIVPKAVARPNQCAVFPHVGSEHPKGYFDTGNTLVSIDPYLYVSVVAVEHMARDLGWVEPGDVAVLEGRVAELEADLAGLAARADAAEAKLAAIDVIESEGFRARRKAGRPPKARAEAPEGAAA